jgi:hypothetical protein
VTRPRALGLQVWLVGALLAVGMAASLAVLLVVLPTLEGNVRSDRADRESSELIRELTGRLNGMRLQSPDLSAELQRIAEELREDMDAQVQITFTTNPLEQPRVVTAPEGAPLVQQGIASAVTGAGVPFDDDRSVIARAPFRVGAGALTVTAAREVTGLAPELAIVRQRVILAMIVVLGLAALAGVAIARVLGGRIRRLASTAATLAGGDLSARYP